MYNNHFVIFCIHHVTIVTFDNGAIHIMIPFLYHSALLITLYAFSHELTML